MLQRRVLALLMALSIAAVTLTSVAWAADPATVSLSADRAPTAVGDTFMLSVNVSGAADLATAAVELQFDPNVLSLKGIAAGSVFAGKGAEVVSGNSEPSLVFIGVALPAGSHAAAAGTLATLTFTVRAQGSTDIRFYDVTGQTGGTGLLLSDGTNDLPVSPSPLPQYHVIIHSTDPASPTLDITSPPGRTGLTREETTAIAGTTLAGAMVSVIRGSETLASQTAGSDGAFRFEVDLVEGTNTFIVAAQTALNSTSSFVVITLDTQPPPLSVTAPAQPVAAETAELRIGTAPGAPVTVNGRAVGMGDFQGWLTVTVSLKAGENAFRVQAADAAGNVASKTVTVLRPAPPGPALNLTPLPATVSAAQQAVSGQTATRARVTVSVNGEARATATAGDDGSFAIIVTLSAGENAIGVTAQAADGGTSTASVGVRYEPPAPPPAPPPADLADMKGHWAAASVRVLVGRGILSGFPDGTFRPDLPVTRAEFAKMIVLALGLETGGEKPDFADADKVPAWAGGYVVAAVQAKLITGYDDKTFRAGDPITRAQAAVILSRALQHQGTALDTTATAFLDGGTIPAWALTAVNATVNAGLVTGYADKTFRPGDTANRAQAAVLIQRLVAPK